MPDPPPSELKRPSTPRWVKVSGIIAVVVVVLIVVLVLAGGEHGPGRHAPGGWQPLRSHTLVQHSP
jgi:uncharacterized membrane protein